MKDNPFIAHCSVVLFISSILGPPLLYIFAHNVPGSDSIIVFFFFASFILSFIFAILSGGIALSKISLFGTPIIAILVTGLFLFGIYRSKKLQKEEIARIETIKKKVQQERMRAEQDAAANP